MANILDRYGIKEVADVTFYKINESTGLPEYPVLYLDTLKVSTIEQTAETSDAKGGKGNAALISWDYGKEINVTLEDALFSAKSMAIMFGNGSVKPYGDSSSAQYIMKSEQWTATATSSTATAAGWKALYEGPDGKSYNKMNPKYYNAEGEVVSTFTNKEKYFCSFDIAVAGAVIEVSANSFPGTYYVTGDTFARSETSGDDEFFQFIIPKAKVQSGNTITLQAEGDPSTFSMNLKVMRPADGVMMRLVKYEAVGGDKTVVNTTPIPHNHALDAADTNPDYIVALNDDKTSATITIEGAESATVTPTGFVTTAVADGVLTITRGTSNGTCKVVTAGTVKNIEVSVTGA